MGMRERIDGIMGDCNALSSGDGFCESVVDRWL